MADKRISQLIERVDIANNDVLPIVASGATTTNKVTISTIQNWMQDNLDVGVTSVGITLGSSGTDVNVTGSPITTSGNITINIPTASATNRGLLSSADWSTFNAKQPAGNYVTLDTTQTITAHKTFTASGGQPSITINHSSGAGHALDITKAGNGEGIRVNKTSGSGNAMSVVGTLEATTLVRTGGTSSQFLKADGSVDSSTYVTTDTNQSITGFKSFANGFSLASAGGTNQPSTFKNIGTLHEGTASVNQIGFNSGNNIYFGKGLNNGGVITWNNAAVRYYALPNADGTLALTSDLGNYVPYTGATSNVDLGSNSLSSRNLIANGGLNTGALLLKNANQASLINTGYFTLTPSSTTTSISFGYSTGANTWKSAIFSSHLLTDNTPTVFSLPNGGGTLALTSDLGGYLPLTGGTLTGALNGTVANFTGNGTFGGDLQSSTRVAASTGGQAIILTANSGGTTNRIETTGVLPMALVSGGNITLAAGGTTPQITLASSGAVTFANKITINTPSDGIGVLLNGRTSDNFSSIRFGANTGGGQYNSINVSSSSFDIISIGNTPITFGTNTTGGGGTRMTIGGNGTITLAGALNGTSASFTGNVGIGGASGSQKLEVQGTTGTITLIKDTGAFAGLIIDATSTPFSRYSNNGTGKFELGYFNNNFYFNNNTGVNDTNAALKISSTGAATFSSSVTANSLLVERSASRNMLGISSISLPTSGAEEGVAVVKTNSNLWQMSLVGYAADSKGMRIYNTGGAGNTSLEVATGAGTAFIVNGSGNVGIGTPSPSARLHVEIPIESPASGSVALTARTSNGANDVFRWFDGAIQLGVFRNNGNVGIGTPSPTSKIQISSTSAGAATVAAFLLNESRDINTEVRLAFAANTNNDIASNRYSYISALNTTGNSNGQSMIFATNQDGAAATEKIRITSGGYLKASNTGSYVNATAPYHELNNNSDARVAILTNRSTTLTGQNGIMVYFNNAAPNNTTSSFIACEDSSNLRFIVYSNGNVQNTNNSYGAISDAKLKENIEDATPKLDDLMKVKVRNYNLIGEDKKQIGVIAQELEEVFPAMIDESEDFEEVEVPQVDEEGNEILNEEGEVVTTKERVSKGTTTKSVKYSVFVPMLIKAMQEQQEQIKSLTEQVEALKSQING